MESEMDVEEQVEANVEPEVEEFEVEKVVGKRTAKGKVQYNIKWKGFPSSENTWEPEQNLDCPELIQEYERAEKEKLRKEEERKEAEKAEKKEKTTKKKLSTSVTTEKEEEVVPKRSKVEKVIEKVGFQRGLEPEKIVGATDSSGQLTFLMKWKGSDEADLVTSEEANEKCPHVVIAFYEERLTWHTIAQQ